METVNYYLDKEIEQNGSFLFKGIKGTIIRLNTLKISQKAIKVESEKRLPVWIPKSGLKKCGNVFEFENWYRKLLLQEEKGFVFRSLS